MIPTTVGRTRHAGLSVVRRKDAAEKLARSSTSALSLVEPLNVREAFGLSWIGLHVSPLRFFFVHLIYWYPDFIVDIFKLADSQNLESQNLDVYVFAFFRRGDFTFRSSSSWIDGYARCVTTSEISTDRRYRRE